MSEEAPTLVVVGRTNKGKSSVVATLAELRPGRGPAIGERPGTTTTTRGYPIEVDGEVVLRLVDTPGLEEAPRAREWLVSHSASAADRPETLARFVETFEGTGEFGMEVRALRPIIDGGGILYVVDGTQPYRPRAEAEMEVLQWAARPSTALINRIRHPESDAAERVERHVEGWRAALSQYFSTVEEFDAHRATFAQRVEILRTFAALDEAWRRPMRRAVDALLAQRRQRNLEAAAVLADLVVDAVAYTAEVTLPEGQDAERFRKKLYERYHAELSRQEAKARRRIEALYGHGALGEDAPLERAPFEEDLFSEASWSTFGLSPKTLVLLSAAGGATAGGAIDAAVGGASWGTGAALGGVGAAGLAAYQLGRRFAQVSMDRGPLAVRRMLRGERRLRIGPHPNPNFGWVLLDRALIHFEVVRNWAHARPTEEAQEVLAALPKPSDDVPDDRRKAIHKVLTALRKKPHDPPSELRVELQRLLVQQVEEDLG
ncbi:MAG: GTPase/DUF3482 domain-containing protein [Myxococcota bacterium]